MNSDTEIITKENHPELFIMKNGKLAKGFVETTMTVKYNGGLKNLLEKASNLGYRKREVEEVIMSLTSSTNQNKNANYQ